MIREESKVSDIADYQNNDGIFGGRYREQGWFPLNDGSTSQDNSGGDGMDNDKILEKYLDKIDADRRESEERTRNEFKEREDRFERRANEMEERVSSLFSDSIQKIEDDLKNHEKILESNFKNMDTKINHINKQVDEVHEKTRFWVNLIVPSIVAIIIGAATVLTTLYVAN